MKRLNRLSALLLAILLVASTVRVIPAEATDADDAWYSEMFSTVASAFYLVSQPDDALILRDDILLTPAVLCDNYKGGVVDLPRLQMEYHYTLSSKNENYILPATLYPVLAWYNAAVGTDTVLSIENSNDEIVASFRIGISDSYNPTSNKAMAGIDYWYADKTTSVSPDGSITEQAKTVFKDTSQNIVNKLVAAGDKMRHYNTARNVVTVYDHGMHKDSIVLPQYMYTTDNVSPYGRLIKYASNYTYESFDANSYLFNKLDGDKVVKEYDVKKYSKILTTGSRPGLLFYGSKTADCEFDNNKGIAKTTTNNDDIGAIYSFIATNDKCYFTKIEGGASSDELLTPQPGAPIMSWTLNKTYTLKSGTSWVDAGYTSDPNPKNPNYLNYGPVDFETQLEHHLTTHLKDDWNPSTMQVTPRGEYCKNCNYYALSLLYNAVIPHLGTVTMNNPNYIVTVNYYYMSPEDNTWALLKTVDYNAATFGKAALEKLPGKANYVPDSWYTDMGLTVPVNQKNYSKTQSQVVNLYSQYKFNGGYYYVTYIDDNAKTKVTETYRVSVQPTLPKTPTPPDGYNFANWMIINNIGDTSGAVYTPESFKPTADVMYYFKAVWATKGVITRVDVSKNQYYIGEKLDPATVSVYVRNDDTGNVKKADTKEYTFDNEVIRYQGQNAITVTYTSTGYKYTFYVNGTSRVLSSIEAEYTGGLVKVGSSYNPGAFKVSAIYNDKSISDVTDFSIAPTVCNSVGDNTVVIHYLDCSTTCNVTGIKADDVEQEAPIQSVVVKYSGPKLNVGDSIKYKYLTVIVTYSDGTKVTLADSDYTFSPSKISHEGEERIVCHFGEESAACIVPVYKKGSSKPSSGDKDKPSNGGNQSSGNGSNDNNADAPSNNNPGTSDQPSEPDNNPKIPSVDINGSVDPNDRSDSDITDNDGSENPSDVPTDDNHGGDDEKHNDDTDDKRGTSPGYLNGANILTNVLGVAEDFELGSSTVLGLCKDADNGKSIFVNFINGRNGNTITGECLNIMKEKNVTLYVTMQDASDKTTTVGNWVIVGGSVDNTSASIDLNIMFEKTDKDGERLVYIAPSSAYYPAGLSLSVIPLNSYYSTGDLIRQYTCTPAYTDCLQEKAYAWGESNYVTYDLYSGRSVCLTDSRYVYEDGTSLLADPVKTTPTNPSADDGVEDPEDEEPFDWNASPTDDTETKKKFPVALKVAAGSGAGIIILCLGIVIYSKIKK